MSESDVSQVRLIQQPHKPSARKPLDRMNVSKKQFTNSSTRNNSSPLLKKQYRRSNSMERELSDKYDFQDSEEDEETELSSSFVDKNSSYESSNCSFVDKNSSCGSNNCSNGSFNVHSKKNNKRTPNKSKALEKVKKQSHILSTEHQESMQWKPDSDSTQIHTYLCFFGLLFIVISVLYTFSSNSATTVRNTHQGEGIKEVQPLTYESKINQLEQAVKDIQTSFHKQKSDIWDEIIAGIKEVIQYPEKHSIFVFFANENKTVVCLTESLGFKAKDVLGGEVLILNPKDLENNTGNVLTMLHSMIKRSKIVVIHDLLNINPEALKAFHSVCDSENPLVEGSVYLITMMANGYSNTNALAFVESQLNHTFSRSMNQDILQPLITRITGGAVFPIQPESNVLCPSLYSST